MPLQFSLQSGGGKRQEFTYPSSIEDLCIHKKKLAQICDYFTFSYKQLPILLLTGPAGCGKSTAIRIVASQLGWSFTEWENVSGSAFDEEAFGARERYVGLFEQFESFLVNAFRMSYRKKHFVLVDEYPIVMDNVTMRGKFFALQSKLLAWLSRGKAAVPIVFLWSDCNQPSSEYSDIFCKAFKNSPKVLHICLNELAMTFLKKAIKSHLCATYSNGNGQLKRLSKCVDTVAQVCGGDLRYAINLIQLLANFPLHAQLNPNTLEIFDKDNSLELFHVLGKVLMRRSDFSLLEYSSNSQTMSMMNLYLEQNVFGFYPDIEPLCEYLDLLSISEAFPSWHDDQHCSPLRYLSALYLQKCCKHPVKIPQQMFKKPDFYALCTKLRGKKASNLQSIL